MSGDWTFGFLIPLGALDIDRIMRLFESVALFGWSPVNPVSGDIPGISADGMDEFRFRTSTGAAQWLAMSDGSINFYTSERPLIDGLSDESQCQYLDVSVSVNRRDGYLDHWMRELQVPDRPHFDLLRISVLAGDLSDRGREDNWQLLQRLFHAAVESLGATFCYGIDEYAWEELMRWDCTHSSVVAGQLPPLVSWLTMVPESGPLVSPLTELATLLDRPVGRWGSMATVTLTDFPWQCEPDDLISATRNWRYAHDDHMCP